MTDCFIDTMRPITPAEQDAWSVYLRLHRDLWRPARDMFRRAYIGVQPGINILAVVSESGETDPEVLAQLEAALKGLALEGEVGR